MQNLIAVSQSFGYALCRDQQQYRQPPQPDALLWDFAEKNDETSQQEKLHLQLIAMWLRHEIKSG